MSITNSKCERLKVVAGGKGDSTDGLQDERGGEAVSKRRPPLRRASAPERDVLRLVRATVAQHRACMPLRHMFALYLGWELRQGRLVLRTLAEVLEGCPLHVDEERGMSR
jgi:hypothetical protein